MQNILSVVFFSLCLAVTTADAQRGQNETGKPRSDAPMSQRDANWISQIPVLVALDSDKDGKLSEEEINNATAALMTLDKNNNRQLEPVELAPDFKRARTRNGLSDRARFRGAGGLGGQGGFGGGGGRHGGPGGAGGNGGHGGHGGGNGLNNEEISPSSDGLPKQ